MQHTRLCPQMGENTTDQSSDKPKSIGEPMGLLIGDEGEGEEDDNENEGEEGEKEEDKDD